MSYSFYLGDRLLPVAPARLEIKHSDKLTKIDLASGNEIVFPDTKRLAEVRFSALLPQVRYPFAVYTNGFFHGGRILSEFEALKKSGKPFRFIVLRKVAGVPVASTNMKVVFSEINLREEAGEGSDIYADIKLVEYRDFAVKTSQVNFQVNFADNSSVVRAVDVSPNAPSPRTYTVVRGDSLWMIAHRFLGNGSRYPEVYNLNKTAIDNRNKGTGNPYHTIYPGQVFLLP